MQLKYTPPPCYEALFPTILVPLLICTYPTSIIAIAPPFILEQYSNIEFYMIRLFEGLLLLKDSIIYRAPPPLIDSPIRFLNLL